MTTDLQPAASKQSAPHAPAVGAAVHPQRTKEDTTTIRDMQEPPAESVGQHSRRDALLDAIVADQMSHPGRVACAAVIRQSNDRLAFGKRRSHGDHVTINDHEPQWLLDACAQQIHAGKTDVVVSPDGKFEVICTPLAFGRIAALVTVVKRRATAAARTADVAVAQLAAAHLKAWDDRRRLSELSQQLTATAAILELVGRVEAAASVKQASFTIAAALREHLRCEQVVVGLARRGKTCDVVAVSGVAEVDPHSAQTRAVKTVLDEAALRGEPGGWPPLPGQSVHQLLAHKQLARRDSAVISTPLITTEGATVGALVITGRREMATVPDVAHFVTTLDEPLGSALHAVRQIEGGPMQRLMRRVFSLRDTKKRWIAAALLLTVTVAMLIPVPHRIRCHSVSEPVERRFCVAPHEGLLETTFAEPGDVVEQGQLLARMDGREVRWELAGISAEKTRAAKSRDVYMARHETPDALQAELEMKRLDSRAELLRFRERNLEVTSPIAGIVLSGSLDLRENYPVTKGQALYEIAPLGRLRIDLSVPAEDITHVEVGQSVELWFDGLGDRQFAGQIAKIHPRSEIREGDNVFVAEVEIEDTAGQLRPGMKGFGKIFGKRRALGWVLFHRAWEKVTTAWPW